MKKAALFFAVTGLLAPPLQAADWADTRTGTFVGARLTIGAKTGGQPRAALTVAPTRNHISDDGLISMGIGEGVALNFVPGTRPSLTLAGVRGDRALGLTRRDRLDSDGKLGVSTGGWVAIGVGSVALVLGGLYLIADHIADCDEGECD